MKSTLFLALVLLCIIGLNAHTEHHHHHHHTTTPEKHSSTNPGHKNDPKDPKHSHHDKEDPKHQKDEKKHVAKNKHQKEAQIIEDFLREKLGKGYAYGTSGERLTKKLFQELKHRHGKNFKKSTKQWIMKECYDCSGLVMRALQKVGIKLPHNAKEAWNSNSWKEKGDIKNIPKDKLCIVYRKGSDGMEHTGIYLGNGKVIEAKGADFGVVETSLKEGHWTNFGVPNGLD